MPESATFQKIHEAVDAIRKKTSLRPEVGIVLGSGLGMIADLVENATTIPYTEIPHFHGTTVAGHVGQLVIGNFKGTPTLVLQGRFHVYEGHPMEDVAFPARVAAGLGVHTLILTNAAGGVNKKFKAGDLMLIEDHLNLTGDNPLKGPNIAELGPRFPDMSEAYNKECRAVFKKSARSIRLRLHQGVYAGLLGPTYETPAEIRMYRLLGADAVGMSTVPEAIVANHVGLRVAGISYISNLAAGLSKVKLTHQEVLDNSKKGAEKLAQLLSAAVPLISKIGQITKVKKQTGQKMKKALFDAAKAAREKSHSPYSGVKVGAAIRVKSGKIYTGCNVENSSFGATVCAERTAIQKAVSEEGRIEVMELHVVTDASPPWPPCGLCRQVIAEFAAPELTIYSSNLRGETRTFSFGELYPNGFTPAHMDK